MFTYYIAIHPNHPKARARYTLEVDSRLVHTGWQHTGTYYFTLAEAEAACLLVPDSRVALIENIHPLFSH